MHQGELIWAREAKMHWHASVIEFQLYDIAASASLLSSTGNTTVIKVSRRKINQLIYK
jgi:hypothetical protein